MLTIVLIEWLVPLALLLAVALVRPPGFLQFLLGCLCAGLALLFAWLVLPWHVTSVWWRMLLPFLFLIAVIRSWSRIGTRAGGPPPGMQSAVNVLVYLAMIGLFGWLSAKALLGYQAPRDSIRLASPLRDGYYVVGHGGASGWLNGHFRVRPQRFALDILGLNAWGARKVPFSASTDLDGYAIFGHPVYAPCEGPVIMAVDGLPDLVPGQSDRNNLAGNHVVLECEGLKVVLAHLREGSLDVNVGDWVTPDMCIARVGNSGNTSEPHLHLHVEHGGQWDRILDGDAVPMLIDDRFLVRGHRILWQGD